MKRGEPYTINCSLQAACLRLVVKVSEFVKAGVQVARALPLFLSDGLSTCEPAPPEMRHRIASPPRSGEATAIFLVSLRLDLGNASIHFATRAPSTLPRGSRFSNSKRCAEAGSEAAQQSAAVTTMASHSVEAFRCSRVRPRSGALEHVRFVRVNAK